MAIGPGKARHAADLFILIEQRTAQRRTFIGENDARAGACRRQRRHQAGRAGTHHQQIAMGIGLFILVRIRFLGSAPRPAAFRMIGS